MKTYNALVFDIKRFAVHDGTGLRTTVFFKGCPLRCKWCQNPEGLSSKRSLLYFENSCIHCKRCEKNSHNGQIIFENNRLNFNLQYKGDFDNLIRVCPAAAIRYDCTEYDIETLIDKIKEDRVFFRDDGGVTFSGGEPLLQGEFLLEVLKRCQQEGIHTAIETTMFAPLDFIKKILPYLDLIYIDLKVFDEKEHERLTGVSSKKIKKHIQYVLESEYKSKVIIRTPLVPSMTATDGNISAISKFLVNIYSEVQYELLNYNPLASAKYALVGLEYEVDKNYSGYNKEELEHFYDIVYEMGLKNLIIE